MKKILLCLAFFIPVCLLAQGDFKDDETDIIYKQPEISQSPFVNTGDLGYDYCQILGKSKFLSKKVNIIIDYGQELDWLHQYEFIIDNSTGKKAVFNSMVDALNFMSKLGWEFVNAYVITVGGQNVYHYLLKRQKK